MKKKLLSLVLVLLIAFSTVALTACGGQQPAPEDSSSPESSAPEAPSTNGAAANFEVPEGGYDGSEVTITFYHTMGENLSTVLDQYITEFNKLYPNIHVKHEKMGGYDDVREQISTEITVGNQPNLAYCYPDHVALYNLAKAVIQMDNLIDSQIEVKRADGTTEILGLTDEQKADFIEGYYNEGRQFGDGLMYTLPMSKSTEVLYYDKTFFDENGLTPPATWEEMEALCAKIKEIDPESCPLGYDSEANWFITMCEQYQSPYTSATGDHYIFNDAKNKEFVKMFNSWYQKGYLTTQKIYGGYTSGLFTAEDGMRSYMSIGSSAGATHQLPQTDANGNYRFEVGIATIPQVDAANKKVISQGPSLCIFKDSNPQEVLASWLFVKFLTTNVDFQSEFAMASGYVPVLKSVSDNAAYSEFLSNADGGKYIAALSAKVCLDQVDAYYTSPAFNGSSTARDQVGGLMVKALTAKGDDVDAQIDKAFQEAMDECEYAN